MIRAPIYEIVAGGKCNKNKVPGRGFGWFLSNSFAACARDQMLEALVSNQILTQEEVQYFMDVTKCDSLNSIKNQVAKNED